jgi:hypothetical protein
MSVAVPDPQSQVRRLASGRVSPGLKVGVGVLSVVIPFLGPVVGFIMGIIFVADASPAKKSVGKLWLLLACVGLIFHCMLSQGRYWGVSSY